MKMKRIVECIVGFVVISVNSGGFAYPIADSFQFPLDNYNVGCNDFWGTCVRDRHLGEDVEAVATTQVKAIGNGIVKHAQYHAPVYDNEGNLVQRNYGGMYIIEHTLPNGEKVCSIYAHLNFDSFTRDTTDGNNAVEKDDYLGDVGTYAQNGGWSEHLHFGIRKGAFPSDWWRTICDDEWIFGGYTECSSVKDDWYNPTSDLTNGVGFIESHYPKMVTYEFPDTGQDKCYDNDEEIPCPSSGEPFCGQDATYIINPMSFVKLDGDGKELPDTAVSWVMIKDNNTDLIWEVKSPNPGNINYTEDTYNWYEATGTYDPTYNPDSKSHIGTLNDFGHGGFSDWRLPSDLELRSIVDYGLSGIAFSSGAPIAINTDYFPYCQPWVYWSNTPKVQSSNDTLRLINFGSGSDGNSTKSTERYVRAVRGLQLNSSFVDNNEMVTDISTGLMWQQDAGSSTLYWEEALSYCENLSLAGYDDWRLPNIKELEGIEVLSYYNPTIDPIFNCYSQPYWSSTTMPYPNVKYYAWIVNFRHGDNGLLKKSGGYPAAYIRCVRGKSENTSLRDQAVTQLLPALDITLDVFYTIDQYASHTYNTLIQGIKAFKRAVLNWQGSEIKITLYDPSGNVYGEYQSTNPPITVEIPIPAEGVWKYEITAIDVPYNNYPFALVAGTPNLCDFEPDGDIDGSDLAVFAEHFGGTDCNGNCQGDFEPDGDVDCDDLFFFSTQFGF